MPDTYKLYTRQHRLLCEALRRYTRFRADERLGQAWTGLGSYTNYKSAIDAGLMTYVHEPHPGYIQWWRLTELGARIVQQWLDSGYTHLNIENADFPPYQGTLTERR